jgi:hypothetical protein
MGRPLDGRSNRSSQGLPPVIGSGLHSVAHGSAEDPFAVGAPLYPGMRSSHSMLAGL